MSWHFSQALVEEYLGANSSAGEPSAPSNGTPTHGMFWSPGKTTDASTPSRSGMMFRPLTDTHGEAVLMSCLEASLVRTSAPQAREPESKESEVECGNTWHELSVKFDPASSSWKTHQCLWEEVLPWSSVTLPKWGLMRDGVLWERTIAALPTEETESGLWRTPAASEPGVKAERLIPIDGGTPGGMNRHFDKHTGRMAQIGLEQQVKLRAMWPTPCARDWKGSNSQSGLTRQDGKSRMDQLPNAVAYGGDQTQQSGQLNPMWVAWLMGWPLAWTSCDALATDKFQQWLRSHGKS
jgi:hypothetical protein